MASAAMQLTCYAHITNQLFGLRHSDLQTYTKRTTPPVACLVNADFATAQGHRHNFDIADQGTHGTKGLKAVAAEGPTAGLDA